MRQGNRLARPLIVLVVMLPFWVVYGTTISSKKQVSKGKCDKGIVTGAKVKKMTNVRFSKREKAIREAKAIAEILGSVKKNGKKNPAFLAEALAFLAGATEILWAIGNCALAYRYAQANWNGNYSEGISAHGTAQVVNATKSFGRKNSIKSSIGAKNNVVTSSNTKSLGNVRYITK